MATELLIVLIVLGVLVFTGLTLLIVFSIINAVYKKFVINHSEAIKELKTINGNYKFNKLPNHDLKHSYDNENMFDDISCEDYLIYQLVFLKPKIYKCLEATKENRERKEKYDQEVKEKCSLEHFDTNELPRNRRRLIKTERKVFNQTLKTPVTQYSIHVRLILTKINGERRTSKSDLFDERDIRNLLYRMNKKDGKFYLDQEIWNSICRVERGKVTNKMRFAVYDRDGWRCRKCGRKTNDLEVDHIYPIAKGGKTTFDNLQTLCHRCNVKKGANIEY